MVSRNGEGAGSRSSRVESVWVCYGLRLPSDCLTSSGCEPQQCRGGWLSMGTHLQPWQ